MFNFTTYSIKCPNFTMPLMNTTFQNILSARDAHILYRNYSGMSSYFDNIHLDKLSLGTGTLAELGHTTGTHICDTCKPEL